MAQQLKLEEPLADYHHFAGGCYVPGMRTSSSGGLLSRNNSQLRYMVPTIYGLEKVLSQGKRPFAPEINHQTSSSLQNNALLSSTAVILGGDKTANCEKYNSFNNKLQLIRAANNSPCILQQHVAHNKLSNMFWDGGNNARNSPLLMTGDHIYASLSDSLRHQADDSPLPSKPDPSFFLDNFDSLDSQLTAADTDILDGGDEDDDNLSDSETLSLDDVSFTTSANDDFEFHDTRGKDADSIEKELYDAKLTASASADNLDTSLDLSLTCTHLSSDSDDESSLEMYREDVYRRFEPKLAVRKQLSKLCKRSNLADKRQFFSTNDLQKLATTDDANSNHFVSRIPRGVRAASLTNLTKEDKLRRIAAESDLFLNKKQHQQPIARFLGTVHENTPSDAGKSERKLGSNNHVAKLIATEQKLSNNSISGAKQHLQSHCNAIIFDGSETSHAVMSGDMLTNSNSSNSKNSGSGYNNDCKLRDAFKKHNLRNSLILRQKALQKKTVKPRFKKNNTSSVNNNATSKKCLNNDNTKYDASYQPIKLRSRTVTSTIPVPITASSATSSSTTTKVDGAKPRFGLSNINRIGSYAQDWNRVDLLKANGVVHDGSRDVHKQPISMTFH